MKRTHGFVVKCCLCTLLTCTLATSPLLADSASRRPAKLEALLQSAQSWLAGWLVPAMLASRTQKDETNGGTGGGTGTTIPVGENPGNMPMWGSCIDPQGMCGM